MSIDRTSGRCPEVARLSQARALALAVALSTTGLFGCVAEMPSPPGSDDRFLVEPVRLTHQVTFAGDASEIGAAEGHQLAIFLDEVDPEGEAEIYLDAGGPQKNGRVDAVAATLGQLGRETSGGGVAHGNEHGVTVTVMEDVILPEACLSGDQWPDPRLAPASCTQGLTLVRMVEDKRDLFQGRTLGPALSATAAASAARHLERDAPSPREERPASSDAETTPRLPPSPLTRDASY